MPLIYSNNPIGLVAVANRTGDYSEEDVNTLESLAPAMVQALVKKWAEEEIRRSKKSLEQIVKERTADLETQKEILQKIPDNIPAMIAFYTRGDVSFLNRTALETIGITREELPFTDIMNRCYPDPRYRREVMKYMVEAPPEWREIRMVVGDGQEIDSLWRNFRLEDGSYIGIGLDVSEQKATEKKMQYYIQALEKTRKKLSRLSSESARLQMSKDDLGFLQISVSDHGVGFDPARVAEKALDAVDHFGLFSIQERLEIIGGYMEIESSPGNGAVFNLVVPVDGQMEGSSPVAA